METKQHHPHSQNLAGYHTNPRTQTRSWASIWIMQVCIPNIVLCARLPHKVRAAVSGKATNSINVYACTSTIFVMAAPPCHRNTMLLNHGCGLISPEEFRSARKAHLLPSLPSYRATNANDKKGTLKTPAFWLESLHCSSSLIWRWQNAWEGRRSCILCYWWWLTKEQIHLSRNVERFQVKSSDRDAITSRCHSKRVKDWWWLV